jgi:hypothetical protein
MIALAWTPAWAATITSVTSGNWGNPSTWGGVVPDAGDSVIIAPGTTVDLSGWTAYAASLEIQGTFEGSGHLTISEGGEFINSGTLYDMGRLIFTGSAVVSGTVQAGIVEAGGAVDFGPDFSIVDWLIMGPGSSAVNNGPVYLQEWTKLEYDTGAVTIPTLEWRSGDTLMTGAAGHVQVNAGTTIDLSSLGDRTVVDSVSGINLAGGSLISTPGTLTTSTLFLQLAATFDGNGGTLHVGSINNTPASGPAFNANGNAVIFNQSPQCFLMLNHAVAFHDLSVAPGVVLTQGYGDATVTGTLVNEGTIRRTLSSGSPGLLDFGLTEVLVDVGDPSSLVSIRVDRIDTNAPEATLPGLQTGKHWILTPDPVTNDFTVDITLPHPGFPDPWTARHTGSEWVVGRTSFDASSVTLGGVSELSPWTVATDPTVPVALSLLSVR